MPDEQSMQPMQAMQPNASQPRSMDINAGNKWPRGVRTSLCAAERRTRRVKSKERDDDGPRSLAAALRTADRAHSALPWPSSSQA